MVELSQNIISDPSLLSKIRKFGKFDAQGCFNCGSCTVICSLVNGSASFPRRQIQYGLWGLKPLVIGTLEPWLCYYCGDCSTTCPRQAEPGEAMMTLRRYLIAQYDWIGFTSRIYTSTAWMIGALVVSSLAMLVSILLFFSHHLLEFGHLFTISAVFAVFAIVYVPNILRMYWFTLRRNNLKVPFSLYLNELKSLLYAVTQLQIIKCKGEKKGFWLKHLLVSVSWVLTVTMSCLGLLGTTYTYPVYHPFKVAMIIIPAILFVFTGILIIDRINKREGEMHKFSKFSDWAFLIGLFMMAFTFWLTYIMLSLGMKQFGYWMFVFHLMILSPWALVLVPFSKTTHFLYRPLAFYFSAIKEKASQMKSGEEGKLSLQGG